MIRVVLDTNILISGVLHIGKPEKLIGLAIKGELEIVSSVGVVDEFRDVIGRDKFGFSPKEQEFIVNFIIRLSHLIVVKSNFKAVEKDHDDDIFINAAYDGNAKYIVSGDRHLLDMKEFKGIKIITAKQMLQLLGRL